MELALSPVLEFSSGSMATLLSVPGSLSSTAPSNTLSSLLPRPNTQSSWDWRELRHRQSKDSPRTATAWSESKDF